MAKAYFLSNTDAGRRGWISNFANKLGIHGATVGVATTEISASLADSLAYAYVCDVRELITQYTQRWTAYKNALANGGSAAGAIPAALVLPTPPAAVPGDIFGRNTNLALRIKHHPGYNESIGEDLGIIGAEVAAPDPATFKPVLTISLQAGHPLVAWPRQGTAALEIKVDRDGKGFVPLAIDTVPDYLDTAPVPTASAGAVWRYKAIYRLDDEQVGQWSDVASIAVGVD
jgi:hypothetical protein